MTHYLRIDGSGKGQEIWRIDDNEAVRLGVTNPKDGPGAYFRREESETIWQAIGRMTPWFHDDVSPFHQTTLGPRQFYPRIARPLAPGVGHSLRSPSADREADVVAMGRGQATALMRQLDLICQTVHPASETLDVFGHQIRNLLILAATEVETHWRGVLVANGVLKDRYSTADYVRLLKPMRLDEYAVAFPSQPWLPSVTPFAHWDADRPTASLDWYDAYNAVKHNREHDFARASLRHAFSAVSAVIVLLAAQFSRSIGLGGASELSAYFRFSQTPIWSPAEIYIDLAETDVEWTPGPLPDGEDGKS